MLSETLTEGLNLYKIGPKLRELRLKKELGLVQLAEHTGVSPSLLSKIERGQIYPTLPTLLRIALVFGVGLEYFFGGRSELPLVAVVRRKDRLRLPNRVDPDELTYLFESLDFPVTDRRMEAYFAEFPLRSKPSRPHRHVGAEFVFVLKGELVIDIGDAEHRLLDGDGIYFDSGTPHSYRRDGQFECTAIVVVSS